MSKMTAKQKQELKQKQALNDLTQAKIMEIKKQMDAVNKLLERTSAKIISLHDDAQNFKSINATDDNELKKLRSKVIKSLDTAIAALQALRRINGAIARNYKKQLQKLRTEMLP
jgi:hypothetical protein